MNTKTCPKCQAKWIDGQHYWFTGVVGSEADLAGLVCDKLGNDQCINPARGTKHNGDTWEKRLGELEVLQDRMTNEN